MSYKFKVTTLFPVPASFGRRVYMRLFRWAIITRSFLRRCEQPFMRFFHWKYSQIFIPLAFATGVGMALANKFIGAYVFFLLMGTWWIFCWLASNPVTRKRVLLKNRKIRRTPVLLRTAKEATYRDDLGDVPTGCGHNPWLY
jgi:hypothetical protein